jgi:cytochrome b involved in lipid metabolism
LYNRKIMQKEIIGIIAILAIALGGYWYFAKGTTSDMPNTTETPSTQTPTGGTGTVSTEPTPTPTGPRVFTMAEVAMHNSQASCFSVIRGNVYDLTSWINQHPGGASKILALCGRDGTSSFEGQHGGSSRQENTLAGFQIGVLAN